MINNRCADLDSILIDRLMIKIGLGFIIIKATVSSKKNLSKIAFCFRCATRKTTKSGFDARKRAIICKEN